MEGQVNTTQHNTRRDEMRWDEMRWDEMRWDIVEYVVNVKITHWSLSCFQNMTTRVNSTVLCRPSVCLSVCLSVDDKARNEYKHEYVQGHECYY